MSKRQFLLNLSRSDVAIARYEAKKEKREAHGDPDRDGKPKVKLDSSIKKNSAFVKKLTGIKEAQLESLSKELDGLNFRFLGFLYIFNLFLNFETKIKNPDFLKPLRNRGGGLTGRGQVQIKRCQRSRYNCLKASFAL